MDTALKLFWSASYGSIYPTLNSMVNDGMVTKDELRYETLLKVFFGDEIDLSITLEHIHNFQLKIMNKLPYLQDTVHTLSKIQDKEEAHKYFLLTAIFGKRLYEAYLEWSRDAKSVKTKTLIITSDSYKTIKSSIPYSLANYFKNPP